MKPYKNSVISEGQRATFYASQHFVNWCKIY